MSGLMKSIKADLYSQIPDSLFVANPHLLPSKGDETTNLSTMGKDGYDYEFEPTPDPKYECPICLLILCEPMQTECGHRFCKSCIDRWLTEGNCKCPIDNADVDQNKMFPDNYVKREILSMKVHCPYSRNGCKHIVELNQIEEHQETCHFNSVMCPLNCNKFILKRDITNHKETECVKRNIVCSLCLGSLIFEDYGEHEGVCPKQLVPCSFCKADVLRVMVPEHIAVDCPNAAIKCCFYIFGCNKEIERLKMEKHMKTNVQKHLQLLCHAFVKLLNFQNIESILSSIETGNAVSQSQPNVTDPEIVGDLPTLLQNAEGGASGNAEANMLKFSQGPSRTISSISQPLPSLPPNVPIIRSQSVKVPNLAKCNAGDTASSSDIFDFEFQSLKERNIYQEESLARHSHELLELQFRHDHIERINKETQQKLRAIEEKVNRLTELEGRLCNGLYIWKIKNYLRHRHKAISGEMPVLHSPPFYSNYYGYKLCMRCNLNGVDYSQGTHLSVFIHFMQGEWDDTLTWPFRGKIILSVIDQNPNIEERRHSVESLISKPTLDAFQKPTTHRNHKGFGYMEYVPLSELDNSTYVLNDTLILKAQIFPEF
ncbi:TNF receptor-associated factor 6-like isoform X1 [Octopus sinensis]|uniref:TNF receptor-associated factor 6-like isoform X1 n=3 Tax=Octopus sinensis TaxID=2607531 RepID=A0A6P7SKK9_9MOLL|nr:TNF receptor-associated factor 6-like isoform X1 [Octopus sinensis]